MDDQKNPVAGQPTEDEETEDVSATHASRARNRTVVLSPDVAGQVRAMLHGTPSEGDAKRRDPLSEILPPAHWEAAGRSEPPARPAESAHGNSGSQPAAGRGFSADAQGYTRPPRKGGTAKFQAQMPAPSFAPSAAAPVAPQAAPKVERKSKVIGFFVSYDNREIGEVFEVCQGRWLLTSRASEHGDHIIVEDPTISPLHAIVRVTPEGKVQVLDQLSEFGTGVLRVGATEEEEVSGVMVNLQHGDRIRFGKRYFTVCLIPLVAAPAKEKAASE